MHIIKFGVAHCLRTFSEYEAPGNWCCLYLQDVTCHYTKKYCNFTYTHIKFTITIRPHSVIRKIKIIHISDKKKLFALGKYTRKTVNFMSHAGKSKCLRKLHTGNSSHVRRRSEFDACTKTRKHKKNKHHVKFNFPKKKLTKRNKIQGIRQK
jgi:hypothetical protein